jgi:hypothetical protein
MTMIVIISDNILFKLSSKKWIVVLDIITTGVLGLYGSSSCSSNIVSVPRPDETLRNVNLKVLPMETHPGGRPFRTPQPTNQPDGDLVHFALLSFLYYSFLILLSYMSYMYYM